jgi:hypothetical protein
MSWPPGGQHLANPGPFLEDPELSQAERESIAPLADWVVAMIRDSESSVSRPSLKDYIVHQVADNTVR